MSRDMKGNSLSDKDQSESDEQVIRGILQQCIKYPDRKDTIEGILKWWLPEGRTEWRKEEVQKALDFLTAKGWLTVRNTSHSQKIYGFNMKRTEEIGKFLNESEKDQEG